MIYYQQLDERYQKIWKEYFINPESNEQIKPKNIDERMLVDSVSAVWSTYKQKFPIKYLKQINAIAFVGRVEHFKRVFALFLFYSNHYDIYFYGDNEEVDSLKLIHEVEGMPKCGLPSVF